MASADVTIDNTDGTVTLTGTWTASTSYGNYYGTNFVHDGNSGKGSRTARYTPTLPAAGNYEVYAWWVSDNSRANNVPYIITYNGGTATVTVNQKAGGGQWALLGRYNFAAGTAGNVLISNTGTTGYVIADAVKFVPSIVVDNSDSTGVTLTGTWTPGVTTPGYYGANYLNDGNTGKGARTVRFTPNVPATGLYEVQSIWTSGSNRASNVPVDIVNADGTTSVTVDQRGDGGAWASLGVFNFNAGTGGSVLVKNTGTDNYVIADAVKLVPQLVVDNAAGTGLTVTGSWTALTTPAGFFAADYLSDGNTGKGAKSVRFTPTVVTADRYDVFARWAAASDRATNTPVTIAYSGGTAALAVDQRAHGGEWVFLGNYPFDAGTGGSVLFSNTGTTGAVVADAIRLSPHFYPPARVSVVSPEYNENVSGNTTISVVAPRFTSITAKCWLSAGGANGSESTVATVTLSSSGNGTFVLPANSYPHGPLTVRITGVNGTISDTCYLQLYNLGGTPWNEGIPAATPAPAAGLSLVYADDFNTPTSISSNGLGAAYGAHKTGGGDFSGIPFADPVGAGNPFSQVDSYLRIRADAGYNTTGLISSLRSDLTGFWARCPAYFECRFVAQSASGTWPAFWLLSFDNDLAGPCDELDIIEAYGGETPVDANAPRKYQVTSHNWNQTGIPANEKISKTVDMSTIGGAAGWAFTPHTYGCLVGTTDTIYYLDGIEVGRHATSPVSLTDKFFFMVNFAVAGISGWPKDLSRYDGVADMYVDYVRVYANPALASSTTREIEAAQLVSSTDSVTSFSESGASGGNAQKLNSNAVNDSVTFRVNVPQPGTYTIMLRAKQYISRGKFQLSIDGVDQGTVQDQYGSATTFVEYNLGTTTFTTAGDKNFKFTVVGKNPSSSGYDLTFDTIRLQ